MSYSFLGLLFGWMSLARRQVILFVVREITLQGSMVLPSLALLILSRSTPKTPDELKEIVYLLIGGYILWLIIRTMSYAYSAGSLRQQCDTFVRDDMILRHIFSSDPQILERIGTGRLISLYMRDAREIMVLSIGVIPQIITLLIAIGFSLYYLVSLSVVWVFFVVVFLVLLAGVLAYWVYRSNTPHHQEMYRIFKEFDQMNNRYLSQPLLPIMGGTQERVIAQNKNLHRKHLSHYFPTSWRFVAVDSFLGGVSFCLFFGGAFLMYRSGASYAESLSVLIFFLFFHARLLQFFGWIIEQFPSLNNILSSRDMLAQLTPFDGYDQGENIDHIAEIECRDVSYAYGDHRAIHSISLRLIRGQSYAFVGASGGGKSTIIKLLSGLIRPLSGEIIINDQVSLQSIAKKSYFAHIGYLSQSPIIYDGSIQDNLVFGMVETPSSSDLLTALRRAHCDFLDGGVYAPECLEIQVGERGVNLSGGQKQRLALARIFVRPYDLIILDEPTAALDIQSERYISEAVAGLKDTSIIITIAHRLKTIEHADEILVISEGTIIEHGSHEDLLSREGAYAKLIQNQSTI